MKEPRIEIHRRTGSKSLTCYYSRRRDNHAEAIEDAMKELRISDGEMAIIAMPTSS